MRKSKVENSQKLKRAQNEVEHIRRIASALVKTATLNQTCEVITKECQSALNADAICLFLLTHEAEYQMVAEYGCSTEFKKQWHRVSAKRFPLVNGKAPYETLFMGAPVEFKREIPDSRKLVDQSKRKLIAYAPMVVNNKSVGILGFSYNSTVGVSRNKEFIKALVSLCSQALERARLFERESAARKDAEVANKAKSRFLASMSHEIRTPIGVIKGFAELIYRSKCLPERERKWMFRILKNTEYLSALIGDVLDLSKIEADCIEVNKSFFSLRKFVDDIKAVTSFKAEEKGVKLHFFFHDSELSLFSDPVHLRQIVINLVSNAIKFTPNGGEIQIHFEFKSSELRIEVKDNGIGIPLEHHSRIFEPYTKVESAAQTVDGGAGLGLSISKRLVKALDGELLLLKSAPGEGSSFVAKVSCTGFAPHQSKSKKQMQAHRELENLKFLLVEDSVDNQDLITHVLSLQGGKVDVADNGVAGVQKALGSDYNLVLMDIQMPGMDGNQAVLELRSRGYNKPIVALSADVITERKRKSLEQGFDDYLSKPIDFNCLIKTLSRLTKVKRGQEKVAEKTKRA